VIVADYIDRRYPHPPCWCFIVDVYQRELGLAVADYTPEGDGLRLFADAFRRRLLADDHGFVQVEDPTDYDVVLMRRTPTRPPHHCGIYYRGHVVHATAGGVLNESAEMVQDRHPVLEYWRSSWFA